MPRMRSPNYPSLSLGAATEALRALWERDNRTVVPPDRVAAALGYTSLSGPARSKLAAMKKFGLLDESTNGMRVSDLGLRILHSRQDEPDYLAAVREAATAPALFSELFQTHSKASEETTKSYLIVKKGFGDEGARIAARTFRETVEFARLGESDYDSIQAADRPMAPFERALAVTERRWPVGPPMEMEQVVHPGSNGFWINVPFGGSSLMVSVQSLGSELTRAHLEKAQQYLKLATDDLSKNSSASNANHKEDREETS
jgi:hypothetical protein